MAILPQLRDIATRAYHWTSSLILDGALNMFVKVLSAGPMPRHVALIMDGNRRYARMHGLPGSQGHMDGYHQLNYLVREWLNKTSVECISIYAWSILNFGRKKSEVEDVMKVLQEMVDGFLTSSLLERKGVRISILGRTEMLPLPMQKAISEVHDKTRKYDRRFVNVYLSYTSADEMTRSVEACVNASIVEARSSKIISKDIESHLDAIHGGDIPMFPVDILIRTGGAKRFSDFLLWQACGNTQIHFVQTLWPVFGFRDLLPIILDYQRTKMYH